MRRPKAEAKHDPPYIEDLIAEATPHLEALGDLTLTDLALATPDQINALHGLWATFSKLPQRKHGYLRWDHEGDHASDKWSDWTGVRFDCQGKARVQASSQVIGRMDRGSPRDQRGYPLLREDGMA